MTAKEVFLERVDYLAGAIEAPVVVNQGITRNRQTGIAGTFRKGLGIVAYNILEDFIKTRTQEILQDLSETRILFSKLPDGLKEACTLGALNALHEKAVLEKKNSGDWMALIQQEAEKIASSGNDPFILSSYSLGMKGSNLTKDSIPEIMRAFGIAKGWETFSNLSSNLGTGTTSPLDSFKNAAKRRHSAAHDPSFDYEFSFLEPISRDIIGIALTFDVFVSVRMRQIKNTLNTKINEHPDVSPRIRYLEKTGTQFRETTTIGGRARKIWPTEDDAIRNLQARLEGKNEVLIVINDSNVVRDWFF